MTDPIDRKKEWQKALGPKMDIEAEESVTEIAMRELSGDREKYPPVGTPKAPSFLARALKGVMRSRPTGESGGAIMQSTWWFEALDISLRPGRIQNRAYLLVAEPLINDLLDPSEHLLPFPEKVELAMKKVPDALRLIYQDLAFMLEPGADIYALRERFFEHLGDAYKSELYEADSIFCKQLQRIGHLIFAETPLYAYGEDAIQTAMEAGGRKAVDYTESLSDILNEDRQAIEKAPAKLTGGLWWVSGEKLRGHFNQDFLPTHRNNPTHILHTSSYELDDGKEFKTTCLRFGSPTIERKKGGAVEISPAFLLFLDSLYAQDPKGKLLSFQHQNPDPEASDKLGLGGKESQRLDAMVELGKRKPDVLTVVTLPMDGDFFKGKGPYKGLMLANTFVKEFKQKMHDPTHAQLPKGHKEQINRVIDQVHQLYFQGTEVSLEEDQRQVFQMIAYAQFEKYFIGALKPEFYHSQCKDAMDRAMSLNVISYFLDALQSGSEQDPIVLENVRTMTHMAPLIVKGIGMHGERFKLLRKVMDHLQGLSKTERAQIRKASPAGVRFQEIQFDRRLGQTVRPLPSAAKSFVQYQERMKHEGKHHYVQEGVKSWDEAVEFLQVLLKSRYQCAPAGVVLSSSKKKPRFGDKISYSTSSGHQIQATLTPHKSGRLDIDWEVSRTP